jgi:hypothetical protein
MLSVFTFVIMGAVAYAYYRDGIFTACCMTVNVFLSGLIAFNFFEPLADIVDLLFYDTLLAGYEDALCMVAIFSLSLAFFRWATNSMASSDLEYHPGMVRGGGVFFGLVTGYLTTGFLLCVLQTLPWHQNFMFFEYEVEVAKPFRRVMPPDRVWLALVNRASSVSFARAKPDETETHVAGAPVPSYEFDPDGSFEIRYARFRRYDNNGKTRAYNGECNPRRDETID